MRLLTDLRKLSKTLERDEWPFETIDSMINSVGQFNCMATLDQVMGCCTAQVDKRDQTRLGITSPWKVYVLNVLPQGIKIAVNFYQREMVKLNSGLDHVKISLDDAAMLGRTTFDKRIEELDEVITRMETSGLQVNMQKSKWEVIQANT